MRKVRKVVIALRERSAGTGASRTDYFLLDSTSPMNAAINASASV